MTGGPPGWMVRAVLALYPADLRERYGPEIADLLAGSSAPWRDVADVAWCALLERGGTMSPYVGRLTTLLAAPAMFWMILVTLTPVGWFLAAALGTLVGRGSVEIAGGGIRFGADSDGAGLVAALAMASLVAAACP